MVVVGNNRAYWGSVVAIGVHYWCYYSLACCFRSSKVDQRSHKRRSFVVVAVVVLGSYSSDSSHVAAVVGGTETPAAGVHIAAPV